MAGVFASLFFEDSFHPGLDEKGRVSEGNGLHADVVGVPKSLENATTREDPPKSPPVPKPEPAPRPRSGPAYVSGTVSVPPLLQKILDPSKVSYSVEAFFNKGLNSASILVAGSNSGVKSFPFKFRQAVLDTVEDHILDRRDVVLQVRVVLCYDPKSNEPCGRHSLPRLEGWVRARVPVVAAGGELVIQIPPIVLNGLIKAPETAKCNQSGHTVSGTIQATPAFLATPARPRKFMLIGMPFYIIPPSGHYASLHEPSALQPQELKSLESVGISYQAITVSDATPVPFSLTIPEKVRELNLHLYMYRCQDGQSEQDCLANAFPLNPNFISGLDQTTGRYKLVPSGFEVPTCGTKGQKFYLHRWTANSWATEASVLGANPPELIEGAAY